MSRIGFTKVFVYLSVYVWADLRRRKRNIGIDMILISIVCRFDYFETYGINFTHHNFTLISNIIFMTQRTSGRMRLLRLFRWCYHNIKSIMFCRTFTIGIWPNLVFLIDIFLFRENQKSRKNKKFLFYFSLYFAAFILLLLEKQVKLANAFRSLNCIASV